MHLQQSMFEVVIKKGLESAYHCFDECIVSGNLQGQYVFKRVYYEVCHLCPNTHLPLNVEEVIMVTFQLDISISFFKIWHRFARKDLIFGTVWHLTSTTDTEPSSSTSKASGDPPRKGGSAHTCTPHLLLFFPICSANFFRTTASYLLPFKIDGTFICGTSSVRLLA